MYNATIRWQLPAVKESGLPLDPAEILHTSVSISGDGGVNFTLVDNVTPDVAQEVVINSLDNGEWILRFEVTDNKNRTGAPYDHAFVSDDSAPGQVSNVEVILA